MAAPASLRLSLRSLPARLGARICLRPSAPRRFGGNYRSPAGPRLMRPAVETGGSPGIWTGFPSATPSGLALGADLPRADCPSPGNLGLPADGDPTRLFVTHACILSSAASGAPRGRAFTGLRNAPLPPAPFGRMQARGFGTALSPATLSARACSTSELLRTLSRGGCFWANLLAVFAGALHFTLSAVQGP